MKEGQDKIFRDRALQLYLQNQHKIVVLRLIRPKLFLYFWVLLAGLILLAGLAGSARIPVSVAGVGLVTREADPSASKPSIVILSMLPPACLGQLRAGQRVTLKTDDLKTALIARIRRVEPDILSAEAIRNRFGLSGVSAELAKGPAALAVAHIEAGRAGLPATAYSEGSYPVRVEVGSRPLLSLIPGFKSLLRDDAAHASS